MNESQSPKNDDDELEFYADGAVSSADARVPHWLKWIYVIMPIWGIIWFYLFWNGSWGWFDRGYWSELQRAANTTYPYNNVDSSAKNGVDEADHRPAR